MFFIPKRENYCRLTNRSPTRNSRMEHETSSSSPPPGMMSHQRNSRMESEPWAVGMRKAKGSAGLSLFASETCSIRGVFFAEANVNGFGWGGCEVAPTHLTALGGVLSAHLLMSDPPATTTAKAIPRIFQQYPCDFDPAPILAATS